MGFTVKWCMRIILYVFCALFSGFCLKSTTVKAARVKRVPRTVVAKPTILPAVSQTTLNSAPKTIVHQLAKVDSALVDPTLHQFASKKLARTVAVQTNKVPKDASVKPQKTVFQTFREHFYENLVEVVPAIISLGGGAVSQRLCFNPVNVLLTNILAMIASGVVDFSVNKAGKKTVPNAVKRTLVMAPLGYGVAILSKHLNDIRRSANAAGKLINEVNNEDQRNKLINTAVSSFTEMQIPVIAEKLKQVATDQAVQAALKDTLSTTLSTVIQDPKNKIVLEALVDNLLKNPKTQEILTNALKASVNLKRFFSTG